MKNVRARRGGRPYNIRHRCFHFLREVVQVDETKYKIVFHSIFDQLIRSATSIGANVVEDDSGSSKKDFANFFKIALKSANETKYWLCLIRDTIDVDQNRINALLKKPMSYLR
jgi:four helix bundle protein